MPVIARIALYAGAAVSLLGATALGQTESKVPWTARILSQKAPAAVGGTLATRGQGFVWDLGVGSKPFVYHGSITHFGSAVEVASNRLILAGIDAGGDVS
jgi:hypothetical protein